jgi:quercetin dioxygenase-like cupin family protein
MTPSRRDLGLLLPVLLASGKPAKAERQTIPSATFDFEAMPKQVNPTNTNVTRNCFDGLTHNGVEVDGHLTELPPGGAPHPPHRHPHEEIIVIVKGTMEVTISGKSSRLGPGGVAYVGSNDEHGWRNVGTDRSLYFVFALGKTA